MNKRTLARNRSSEQPVDPSRHARLCTICSHPDRESIEQAFLQWRSPHHLLNEFKIPNRTIIYRHANALGLFEERRRNLRSALENILEESETVHPTGTEIIAAVRAMTCLKDSGEWVEPPTTRRVLAGAALGHAVAAAISLSSELALQAPESRNLIDTPLETENLIGTPCE